MTVPNTEQERGLASPSELRQGWTGEDSKIVAILPRERLKTRTR